MSICVNYSKRSGLHIINHGKPSRCSRILLDHLDIGHIPFLKRKILKDQLPIYFGLRFSRLLWFVIQKTRHVWIFCEIDRYFIYFKSGNNFHDCSTFLQANGVSHVPFDMPVLPSAIKLKRNFAQFKRVQWTEHLMVSAVGNGKRKPTRQSFIYKTAWRFL